MGVLRQNGLRGCGELRCPVEIGEERPAESCERLRPRWTRTAEAPQTPAQTEAIRSTSPQCPGTSTAMTSANRSQANAIRARAKPTPEGSCPLNEPLINHFYRSPATPNPMAPLSLTSLDGGTRW